MLLRLTEQLGAFPVPAWRTPAEIAAADHRLLLRVLHHPTASDSLLVAESPAGEPLGYVLTTTREDYFTHRPTAHVEVLVVDPRARGQGLGPRLIEGAERWARSRGISQITLNVFVRNQRARALYERLGYQEETLHYRKGL
jgi:ribosomal protein S18 acetylase RimI-like enzyme